MISCQQAEAARLERAGGALPAEQAAALDEHVASCEACEAFTTGIDELEAALGEALLADAERAHGGHAARFLDALRAQPDLGQPLADGAPRVLRRARPSPFRVAGGVLAAAAVVAVAAGVGLLMGPPQVDHGPLALVRGHEVRGYQPGESLRPGDRVRASQAEPVTLPHAQLTPAAGSVLRVDRLLPRTVTLEQGSVDCDVVPGSGQFIVRAELGLVSVVGTRFVVRQLPGALRVTVSEGEVEVTATASGERVLLRPGQEAQLTGDGQTVVTGEAQLPEPAPTPDASPAPVEMVPPETVGEDEVFAQLLNRGEGALFEVQGQVPWLPDGTSLHVTLNTPGMGPQELRVAFFKVVTQGGRFRGSFHWPGKRFAPLAYTTRVQLYVGSQAPQLQAELMQDFGFTARTQQLVTSTRTVLGTPEERQAHAQRSLDVLQGFVDQALELAGRASSVARFDPTDPRRARAHTQFQGKAQALQGALRDFDGGFVALREGDLLHEVRNAINDEMLALDQQAQDPALDPGPLLSGVGVRLDAVAAEIETRRPVDFRVPEEQ
jgi:ferric-dicitrate binding protein FerR (iron transport regulator)